MNTAHLSPQRLRNLQIVAAVAAGVCLPLLGDFLLEAFTFAYQPLNASTWRACTAAGAKIASALLVIAISYRLIRRSTLPGIPTIALLLVLMWATVLLGR